MQEHVHSVTQRYVWQWRVPCKHPLWQMQLMGNKRMKGVQDQIFILDGIFLLQEPERKAYDNFSLV